MNRSCNIILTSTLLLAEGLALSPLGAQDRAETATVKGKQINNSIGMKLKLLPAGTFVMGSNADEAFDSEKPAHQVRLTKPFFIGVYEVTQEQYEKVIGKNPSKFKGSQNPVEQLTWEDAAEFCKQLSELPEEKAAERVYRLPTGAEWEYACRAGAESKYCFGDDPNQLGGYAWFGRNSASSTHPVGQKEPNAWGLYDMHGNVFEYCYDWDGDYPSEAAEDPAGPSTGTGRVIRGGSWGLTEKHCGSSFRLRVNPKTYRSGGLGFRVAVDASKQ